MSARAGMLSRRAFVSGLVGTAVTVANTMQAATRAGGPPLLRTPRSQFIELRPLIETPALRLERIDGKSVGLNEFRGKAVLMNFWATWCPPCRRELPILESLQEATAREPLKIVAVSIDQAERPAVEAFLKRLNITRLRPFLDPLGRIAKHVGPKRQRHLFFGGCRSPISSTPRAGWPATSPARSSGCPTRHEPFCIIARTADPLNLARCEC